MSCLAISEIYGLSATKALAFPIGLDFDSVELNATVSIAQGWIAEGDDFLLRENMPAGNTVLYPSKVIKAFVYRDYYVVHTDIPYEYHCTSGCGCGEKGYFGFDEPQGISAESAGESFMKGGGLLIVIVVLPLLFVAVCFCLMRAQRLKKMRKYEQKKQRAAENALVARAHRPPPQPPGSGRDTRLSWQAAGAAAMLAAHRSPPQPPASSGPAASPLSGGWGAALGAMQMGSPGGAPPMLSTPPVSAGGGGGWGGLLQSSGLSRLAAMQEQPQQPQCLLRGPSPDPSQRLSSFSQMSHPSSPDPRSMSPDPRMGQLSQGQMMSMSGAVAAMQGLSPQMRGGY